MTSALADFQLVPVHDTFLNILRVSMTPHFVTAIPEKI